MSACDSVVLSVFRTSELLVVSSAVVLAVVTCPLLVVDSSASLVVVNMGSAVVSVPILLRIRGEIVVSGFVVVRSTSTATDGCDEEKVVITGGIPVVVADAPSVELASLTMGSVVISGDIVTSPEDEHPAPAEHFVDGITVVVLVSVSVVSSVDFTVLLGT